MSGEFGGDLEKERFLQSLALFARSNRGKRLTEAEWHSSGVGSLFPDVPISEYGFWTIDVLPQYYQVNIWLDFKEAGPAMVIGSKDIPADNKALYQTVEADAAEQRKQEEDAAIKRFIEYAKKNEGKILSHNRYIRNYEWLGILGLVVLSDQKWRIVRDGDLYNIQILDQSDNIVDTFHFRKPKND